MWAALEQMAPDDPRRGVLRDELITMHLPLVHHLARRYRDRGEDMDDLVQVGTVGLIKAIDGFDPSRGLELSTYATPTILGEIKRHFRDRTWALHVPRRLQVLQAQVTECSDRLTLELHRAPTVRELAAALEVSEADILDALDARTAYAADSLHGTPDDDSIPSALSTLGSMDEGFESIDDRETLRPLIEALPDRERAILQMRFFQGMSQSQIAEALGISQMHVSRLLARTLASLRDGMAQG
ncbi:MAG TPA: B/F/G family RNA polymerase sigma-70 factor [Actinobacteria bacterium]|nr:B/F/G family RNA polymerase sigma-70 factor [Actinomycetota bacterium]